MSDKSSRQPWDWQLGEPNLWYSRFDRYRQLGPERSLLGVYNDMRVGRGRQKTGRLHGHWCRQARQWRWRERAEAWDEHERQLSRARRERGIEEMDQRHGQEARALQGMALKRLQSLNPGDLSPALLLRYLVDAAKLERLSQSTPPALVKTEEPKQTGIDYDSLTVEKLREMSDEDLVRVIVAGGGPSDEELERMIIAGGGTINDDGSLGTPPPIPRPPGTA